MNTLIPEGHLGLLYENAALKAVLPPGKHVFSEFFAPQRKVTLIDVRERSSTIKNQEILTADKVSVRLSLLIYFKVVDPKAAVTVVAAYEDRIYEDVQLAARRFLATRTLDQILKDRNELSNAIKTEVSGSAQAYGVEVLRADVKDLVFPSNLREVMNKVIETERQSEAQLIAARTAAEVATLQAKSRAATLEVESKAQLQALEEKIKADEKRVKLLGEHPLLLKLKELEVLEAIGNQGNNHFYVGVDKLARSEK